MKALLVCACALALTACDLVDEGLRRGVESILDQGEADEAHSHRLAPESLPAFFDCLRERGQTVVAAHRGGPGLDLAENSILTFAATLSQAPAILEVDVSETRDGVLVLMHDDTLERTTEGRGAVRDVSVQDLQALRLRSVRGDLLPDHAPTLREALDWADGRTILELDVKRSVSYEDVVAEVRAARAEGRVIFITYSVAGAIRVHRLAPELMISTSIENEADLQELERARVDLTRILAWTGTQEPNGALNVALARRGVEAMFGTLGGRDSWDNRFAASGDDQYAEFAETGLQLISTDRTAAALRDLDGADGVEGYGALQCVGAH
jgi:glycerophosphoryl diester phosphodiesterase